MDKLYPRYKAQQTEMLQRIQDFRNESKLKSVMHDAIFKFIPCEPVMMMLVLQAIL